MIRLNLVVIRSKNPLETAQWYSDVFGLEFVSEKHNDGVLHYSAPLSDGLLEIYPTDEISSKITFGFAVNKIRFEKIAASIKHKILEENLILFKDTDKNSI